MNRITRVRAQTTLNGRSVIVAFRSPYRWRIYENGVDVTKIFGHALRGDPLPRHTPEWDAFHEAVRAGTTAQTISYQ